MSAFACLRCRDPQRPELYLHFASLTALLAHADAAHPCWRQHKFPAAWLDARRGAVPICVRCGFDAREAA